MKKILLLVNDYIFPAHVMDFAVEQSRLDKFKIKALYINGFTSVMDKKSNNVEVQAAGREAKTNMEEAAKNLFINACNAAGILYELDVIKENFLDILIDESAFADLVMCDDDMKVEEYSMNSFLSGTHCPVVLIPKSGPYFNQVIFTYDGTASSIHAMKQFAYLFSFCHQFPVYLVSVLEQNILQMEYDLLVKEWMQLHYPNSSIVILKGDAKSEISAFINQHPNSLVVTGAFGRSALSRLFKESLAPTILERTQSPLFITHA